MRKIILLGILMYVTFSTISICSNASSKYNTLTLKNIEALSSGESEGNKDCYVGTGICVAGGVIYIGKNKK